MRIVVTAEELIEHGVWEEFCELKGINSYAVNEGIIESSEEWSLTKEEAKRFGFI